MNAAMYIYIYIATISLDTLLITTKAWLQNWRSDSQHKIVLKVCESYSTKI